MFYVGCLWNWKVARPVPKETLHSSQRISLVRNETIAIPFLLGDCCHNNCTVITFYSLQVCSNFSTFLLIDLSCVQWLELISTLLWPFRGPFNERAYKGYHVGIVQPHIICISLKELPSGANCNQIRNWKSLRIQLGGETHGRCWLKLETGACRKSANQICMPKHSDYTSKKNDDWISAPCDLRSPYLCT